MFTKTGKGPGVHYQGNATQNNTMMKNENKNPISSVFDYSQIHLALSRWGK